ncbi:FtsW/RodA/SpoVE family cell cycle protein [bacterium]|nr:FtsW/RodA/SpoVE family cell cycle protein [candidate division CSSED10-310 bacterium]
MKKKKTQRSYFIMRPTEFWLLFTEMFLIVWLWIFCTSTQSTDLNILILNLVILAVFLCSVFLSHLLLVIAGSKSDPTFLPLVVLLTGFGLCYQHRLSTISMDSPYDPSLILMLLSPLIVTVTCLIFRKDRIFWLSKTIWIWGVFLIGVPLLVIFAGVEFNGSLFGPGRTTPTELVKPALVVVLSGMLYRCGDRLSKDSSLFSKDTLKSLVFIFFVWLIPQVCFIFQKDLGMVFASFIIFVVLLYTATGRKIFWILGMIGAIIGGCIFRFYIPRGQIRFESWIEPFNHPAESGYQIIQSLFAMFHGGVIGCGIGEGFPVKIPYVHNDFVFASIAEELGLLGSSLLVFAFVYLSRRAYYAASKAKDAFQALVGVGCASLIWIQLFLNVGGVIKLIPMTGVPLPFVSLGGMACLTFAFVIGWNMAISDSG